MRNDRRMFMITMALGPMALLMSKGFGGSMEHLPKLLFIHGRAQQGKNSEALRTSWMTSFERGADELARKLPEKLDVSMPFYGDLLDDFARQYEIPLTTDIQTKGGEVDGEFLRFQAEVAEAIRTRVGITDDQINAEYGPNPKQKGPQNWEWVQAILRAIDSNVSNVTQLALETFTRDVYLYITRASVREEIDYIVAKELTEEPTVVVGHSLGSVVAYSILRSDQRSLNVPLLMTIGSPLGIRPIRNQFRPLRFPNVVESWFNAFDQRDVVALYALDDENFPVVPHVENYAGVKNHTDNRHGIIGYLDDRMVAGRILDRLGA